MKIVAFISLNLSDWWALIFDVVMVLVVLVVVVCFRVKRRFLAIVG